MKDAAVALFAKAAIYLGCSANTCKKGRRSAKILQGSIKSAMMRHVFALGKKSGGHDELRCGLWRSPDKSIGYALIALSLAGRAIIGSAIIKQHPRAHPEAAFSFPASVNKAHTPCGTVDRGLIVAD